jgi:hypothetical protein
MPLWRCNVEKRLDYPICPVCEHAAIVMAASLVVEEMLSRGYKPSIFPSINRPDGKKLVTQVEQEAIRKGY